ncbi:uncharacterized protein EAF01_002413 [Botrytis porri]|uniref:uncharacterized protein n=1 Tax=Botrytis porri TaxID=87229 RepID=UPI0019009C53|nr:uncharacterized protein EAF01_002413 [Botrytis porri]KAF7910904.1 hypothetical protein EAF01_002413 [Botrytis porri]
MVFSILNVCPSCLHNKILCLTVPFVIVGSFYQIQRKWSVIEQFEKLIRERQICTVKPAELHRVINEDNRRLEKHREKFPGPKGLVGSKKYIESTIFLNFDSKVAIRGMRGI